MTVNELLGRISSRELTEWMAFYSLEPFGEQRQDLRFAMLCCLVANMVRGKNQPAFKMDDFLLKFEPKEKESDEMIALKLNMILGGMGK